MIFDWDSNKDKDNARYHDNISFNDAVKVFDDIWAIEEFDSSHSIVGEKRFIRIGLSKQTLLRVVYTVRIDEENEEIFRIITAWKAIGKDKELYDKTRNELD